MALWIAIEYSNVSAKELAEFTKQGGNVKVLTDDPNQLPELSNIVRQFNSNKVDSALITIEGSKKAFM